SLYQIGVLIFVMFLGNSLFLWDRKQRAEDYLLSLPYTKLRLLGIKVLPRLTTAVFFYLVFLLLYLCSGEQFPMVSVFSFTYIYFSLFIIALTLSLCVENYIILAVVTLLAMAGFLGTIFLIPTLLSQWLYGVDINLALENLLSMKFYFGKLPLSFIAIIACLLIPFIAAFIVAFKKIGIHPVSRFNKQYFKIFVPLLAAGVVFVSLLTYPLFTSGDKTYYLTEGRRLIEWSSMAVRLYDEDSVVEIPSSAFNINSILIEAGDSLYAREFNFPGDSTYFLRLDIKTLDIETFYKLEGRNINGFNGPWLFKNTIAIVEGYPGEADKMLHLIDVNTKEGKKIKLQQPSRSNVNLFGADEADGRRSWLVDSESKSGHSVSRLWENGEKEDLGTSKRSPCYVNGLLITYERDTATLRKLVPRGMADAGTAGSVKTIGVGERFVFYSYRPSEFDNPPLKEIIGAVLNHNNDIRKYYTLEMENLELREIKVINDKMEQSTRRDPELKYYMYRPTPDQYYYFEYKREDRRVVSLNIYAFDKDKLTLLKEFPSIDRDVKINYCKGGIVFREPGKLDVYAFPDLRELKFKKLKY
ncbi:MAG: hypothetical protein QG657_1826, partial [Acidobacteriota bacterium]|nr:hypothetical protein [Acidobacteriota bacterium]